MKLDFSKFGELSNAARLACLAFATIGILGIVGAGFCERIKQGAPAEPIAREQLIAPLQFKDGVRFVTPETARCCKAATWVAFGGIGTSALLGMLLLFVFKRFPFEAKP
jgi:hypothetical protein